MIKDLKLSVVKKVKALPPLPESLSKIDSICRDPDPDMNKLVRVVEKDPFLTANFLKMANSPYYGFARRIVSVDQAIKLFGITAVWGFTISAAVRKALKIDLSPYGISTDEFLHTAILESAVMVNWYPSMNDENGEILIPTSFIAHVGKVILASELKVHQLDTKFREALQSADNLSTLEREFTGVSNQEVAGIIFDHWMFPETMVEAIRASENPSVFAEWVQPYAVALQIVQAAVLPNGSLNDESSDNAVQLARNFGMNADILEDVIIKIRSAEES